MATDEIEPIHVQSWQLELAKEFSPNYIHVVQGLLSLAFDRAIVLCIAKKNPSRMIGNINAHHKRPVTFDKYDNLCHSQASRAVL